MARLGRALPKIREQSGSMASMDFALDASRPAKFGEERFFCSSVCYRLRRQAPSDLVQASLAAASPCKDAAGQSYDIEKWQNAPRLKDGRTHIAHTHTHTHILFQKPQALQQSQARSSRQCDSSKLSGTSPGAQPCTPSAWSSCTLCQIEAA